MLVGVLGAGQLGRMLALAGLPLGLRFRFLDPAADSPAGQVAEQVVGGFDDPAAMDAFCDGLDAATWEFENVPVAAARAVAARVALFPPPAALETGQDRLSEKQLFTAMGLEVHPFAPAASADELVQAVGTVGLPAVVKTRRGGYDGKGQAVLRAGATAAEVRGVWGLLGGVPLLVEQMVAFDRELSIIGVRGRDGATVVYPLVENVHAGGILRISRAPADGVSGTLQAQAEKHITAVMERLGYVGVLAIEFFAKGERLLANEMAPRVHNSGHWTIEGAQTSQFENHVRAVAGLALGSTGARGRSVMVNLIGGAPAADDVLRVPGAHLHLYGKESRRGRKVGHVTVNGPDSAAVAESAARVHAMAQQACDRMEAAASVGAGARP